MQTTDQLNTALRGRYRIDRQIGAGGMATVYLAHDVKHERKVAIKVLKPELAVVLGGERFLSEIRVTANLQHPNLLPLFDSGEVDGMLYYVMPYVDGETLRQRIDREKQLPVDEVVRLAVAVANALAYAHQHGVIHRDLKPENILLQADQPVVADFGIALAVSNAGGTRVTQTGLSLGTPQYMSPEQATGDRVIDGRTDIYSLGAVAYEMLTGEPPHTGTTAQAIIARLMTERPRSIRASREMVPEQMEQAIEKALAKLPADRFATATEFAQALQQRPASNESVVRAPTPAVPLTRAKIARRVLPWVIAAAGIVAASVAWLRPRPQARPSMFVVALPDSAKLAEIGGGVRLALSHDGAQLAYVGVAGGQNAIYLRALDDTATRMLRGTERGGYPAFSPDGSWLLFLADGKLKKVSVAGGSPVDVADSTGAADWSDRNDILFARNGGIWRMPADGGTASLVGHPDSSRGQTALASPHALPGGDAALVSVFSGQVTANNATLGVLTFSDGKVTPLLDNVHMGARYVSSGGGHVLYGSNGALFAAPFSLRRLRFTGRPVRVVDGINSRLLGGIEIAASNDGTLAYISGSIGVPLRLVAVDSRGAERAVFNEAKFFGWPRVSPDGKRIAVEIGTGTGVFDVWLYDVASQGLSRITNNFSGVRPVGWSADGRRVFYLALENSGDFQKRRRIASIPWDMSAAPQFVSDFGNAEDASVGPPGSVVATRIYGYTRPGDISIAPLDSASASRPFVTTAADEETPRVSPDGKLLAYGSDETGQFEVYVRSVGSAGGRIQVSAGGGSEPVWAHDGRSLYYRGPQRMMRASLATAPDLAVTKRDTLFADIYRKEVKAVQYDVMPNGELLMLKNDNRPSGRPTVVLNWPELVRRRP